LNNHFFLQSQDHKFDLSRVIDQFTDCIAVFSSDGNCLYVNRPFTALLAAETDTPSLDFNHFLCSQEKTGEIYQALEENGLWLGSYQIPNKINNAQLVMTFAANLDADSGQFITYFVIVGKSTGELEVWDKLLDSEQRYRMLVELSPNLIQIHINGEITFINTAGVHMLGAASAEDVIGQSIYKYIHSSEHNQIKIRIKHEIANRIKVGPIEERWVREDGSELDVEINALPFDYHGQVAVQVIATDITEQKRAREQLNQYTRQLLALNAIGLALVSSLNTNEVLEQVTKNLTEILHAGSLAILLKERNEFTVATCIGENADTFINRRFPFSVIEKYIQLTSSGPLLITGEKLDAYPISQNSGNQSILLEPVLHGEDVIGFLQASYSASTGDLAAEQEILYSISNWIAVALQNSRLYQNERRQHQYAEGLLESASAINSNLDLSQVLERILQQVWRVIPCSATDIMVIDEDYASLVCSLGYDQFGVDQNWLQSIRLPIDKALHFKDIQETRQPVIVRNISQEPGWVTIPGNEWIMSYAAAPLIVKDRVYGFLNLDSNMPNYFDEDTITRLQAFAAQASIAIQNAELVKDLQNALHHEQKMRAQLVQSEKLAAMGRMVASVAHEMNNPLQTIQNCLFILQKEGDIRPELREYLSTGLSEVKRLSGIVDQLREAYRPSIQTERLLVKPFDILENVHVLLKPHLQHKKITWVVSGILDFQVWAYIDPLKQVFINLAQNAIEAMEPDGGTLTIEFGVNSKEGEAVIHFRDTGRGISSELLSNLFDPFFTTREMGFGLGLAICQDIVENHSGTIRVESQPGCGSTFSVYLPVWNNE
jgi:PAS domain S-box-containing protein